MLRVNILWFFSLTLSVACALAATLVQQWARKYLLTTQNTSSPQRQARVRTYLFQGVLRFRLSTIATAVPFLLHASVFLFLAGLIEFLFHINRVLAWVLLGWICIGVKIYLVFTVLPLCYRDCPYMTPMSGLLWRFVQAVQFAFLSTFRRISEIILPKWTSSRMNLKEYVGKCKDRLFGGLQHDLEKSAIGAAPELDAFSMGWTLKSLREPSELESFIAGIPGFLGSVAITSDPPQLTPSSITLYRLLHTSDIQLGHRIGHLLKTQLHTPTVCVDALWHIMHWFDATHVPQWDRVFGEVTLDSLRALRGSRDPAIALVARCAAALSVRVVLKDLRRVFSQATTKALRIAELRKVLHGLMETERPNLVSLTDEQILRDGNLLGIADVLTGVVPLLPGVDKTRAKFLWDTLETLRFGLDLNQVTPGARIAIGGAWYAYEEEFRSSELVPVFPRQPPGTIDHYRARMQDLVGPMVFLGTAGERFSLSTRRDRIVINHDQCNLRRCNLEVRIARSTVHLRTAFYTGGRHERESGYVWCCDSRKKVSSDVARAGTMSRKDGECFYGCNRMCKQGGSRPEFRTLDERRRQRAHTLLLLSLSHRSSRYHVDTGFCFEWRRVEEFGRHAQYSRSSVPPGKVWVSGRALPSTYGIDTP
jgi:hypothetical protein